jgi:hypothetical protein
MPIITSRLTSTGTLFISGEFNEVATSTIRVTTTTYYAANFDEVSIHGSTPAKRETNTGTLLVSDQFDEVTGFVITSGLVGYYNAGNSASRSGTGNIWYDISNSKINAVPNAGVAAPTFNNSGYFEFDRVNTQTFTISTSSPLNPTSWSESWTVGVWMYVPVGATWSNGSNQSHFVSKGQTTGSWGIVRGSGDNTIHAIVRTNAGVYQTGGSIGRDAWYNVVGTWDGTSTVSTYINGVLFDTATVTTATGTPDSTRVFVIGGNTTAVTGQPGEYYEGRIGAVTLYNRNLSSSEIDVNFQALKTQFGI